MLIFKKKPEKKTRRSAAERDAAYLRASGYTYAEFRAFPKAVRHAFYMHRMNAKGRGIAFEFRFREWWELWEASGKWDERRKGGYVMCRNGDAGPYSPGNVYIATSRHNTSTSPRKQTDLPTGVTPWGKKFRAAGQFNGKRKHLGLHDTPEAASAAYQSELARCK